MSTTFVETPTILSGSPPQSRPAFHQSNSWRALSRLSRLPQLWADRRNQRNTLRELADEAHLLADVGLTRPQALREAAKPFWQA
jgi:uncharacterized protein YjiS (DUF1127 family)